MTRRAEPGPAGACTAASVHVVGPIQLDRDEARRIAVRAQLLDARRPSDLLEVVNRLTFLQLDPTAAVAPSADLVAWTRLGAAYEPAHLQRTNRDRTLFEYRATARPMADLGLYRAQMERAPHYLRPREWLTANASFREDVLRRTADSGPLLSRDVPDTSSVPWPSTGWTNNRNTTQMLEILAARGEVAVRGAGASSGSGTSPSASTRSGSRVCRSRRRCASATPDA